MSIVTLLYEDGEEITFEAPQDKALLDAAEDAGAALASDCRSGQCRTCIGRILSGDVDWPSDVTANLSAIELADRFVLPCIARPKSDLKVALPVTRNALIPVRERKASVVAVQLASPDVYRLVLKTPSALPPVRFLAGQYVSLILPGDKIRQYSMSNTSGSRELEFFIKRLAGGAMTAWLEACKPGDTLKIRGPFGTFYRRRDATSSVFVAGGTGLAPILSMLRDMLAAGVQQKVRVIFGVTRSADLFALGELTELCTKLSTTLPSLAMMEPMPDWVGTSGTACDALDDRAAEIVCGGGRAYVCGPPPMTEAVLSWFADRGADLSRVHFEAFVAAQEKVPTT